MVEFGENGESLSLGFESWVPNGMRIFGDLSFYSWGKVPPARESTEMISLMIFEL